MIILNERQHNLQRNLGSHPSSAPNQLWPSWVCAFSSLNLTFSNETVGSHHLPKSPSNSNIS